jgi:RNA polymerase sigma factor (TIGR02999 family)
VESVLIGLIWWYDLPVMDPNVTRILNAVEEGDTRASEELLPLVYDELRRLADMRLASEKHGQTLQATALVHEAYLRLLGPDDRVEQRWDGRGHFFAAAANAMRRILIDRARSKKAIKRGGGLARLTLDPEAMALDDVPAEVVDLDVALQKLALESPQKAELVHLRFFAGLTLAQAASILGISTATADRHWAYARAWLFRELSGSE